MTFSYPLGNSTAEANLARARLERDQAAARLRSNEVVRRARGALSGAAARAESSAHRDDEARTRARGAAARRRAAAFRGRDVDELPRHPGPARSGRREERRAAGAARLPARGDRIRDVAADVDPRPAESAVTPGQSRVRFSPRLPDWNSGLAPSAPAPDRAGPSRIRSATIADVSGASRTPLRKWPVA